MRFLDAEGIAVWCSQRGIVYQKTELGPPRVSAPDESYQIIEFEIPGDSGRKAWLAKALVECVHDGSELMLWIDEWSVWPSSQHMPLFERMRLGLGESSAVNETPGHLAASSETEDAISVLLVCLLFVWDCFTVAGSGETVLFVSHDEFGWVATKSSERSERIRKALEGLVISQE